VKLNRPAKLLLDPWYQRTCGLDFCHETLLAERIEFDVSEEGCLEESSSVIVATRFEWRLLRLDRTSGQ
jgi:hypothetical protein